MRTMHRHCARVSIEFITPFLVAGGEDDPLLDTTPIADPFGLPCLPGTTLAGVLRHAYERCYNAKKTNYIFGFEPPGKTNQGQGSRLWVSFGRIHNSENIPVDGPIEQGLIAEDEVLSAAMIPTVRDHVRIDFRGVAADSGKFDTTALQAGHRFSFDIVLEGNAEDSIQLNNILNLFFKGDIRIGASQRNGFGAFKVIKCVKSSFDLSTPEGWEGFSSWPVRLDEQVQGGDYTGVPVEERESSSISLKMTLEAEGFWGVNGDEPWLLKNEQQNNETSKTPDMNPFRDQCIIWSDDKGSLSEPLPMIPATSIKGALSHRVAFHYNAATGTFADDAVNEENELYCENWLDERSGSNNKAVRLLFGEAADENAGKGQAGRVLIDDVWLDNITDSDFVRVMHNSIDRFTGGTRPGALFEERVIYGKGFSFNLRLLLPVEPEEEFYEAKSALIKALRDLAEGRLQLGAGSGRGNGYFRGTETALEELARFAKEINNE